MARAAQGVQGVGRRQGLQRQCAKGSWDSRAGRVGEAVDVQAEQRREPEESSLPGGAECANSCEARRHAVGRQRRGNQRGARERLGAGSEDADALGVRSVVK